MADLVQTAANVRPSADATTASGTAGGAITAGQPLYQKTSDSKFYPADADAGSNESTVKGIAFTNASADDTVYYQSAGTGMEIGATCTAGAVYVLSGTAGAIAPVADLATGDYTSILGVGDADGNLDLKLFNSGTQVP